MSRALQSNIRRNRLVVSTVFMSATPIFSPPLMLAEHARTSTWTVCYATNEPSCQTGSGLSTKMTLQATATLNLKMKTGRFQPTSYETMRLVCNCWLVVAMRAKCSCHLKRTGLHLPRPLSDEASTTTMQPVSKHKVGMLTTACASMFRLWSSRLGRQLTHTLSAQCQSVPVV